MKRTATFFSLLTLFLFSLPGCEKAKPNLSVAIRDMPAYQNHVGDAQKLSFNIHVGDECVLGRVENEKVYQYTEVTCPGKGHGWVVDHGFMNTDRIRG